MDNEAKVAGALAVIAFLLGSLNGYDMASSNYEDAAIQRGYALYCPSNGSFAWSNECDK